MTIEEIKNEIKQARQARACKGDDCEGPHCPKCGSHTAGYLTEFECCQSCELEEEHIQMEEANLRAEANRETPLGELLDDLDQGVSDQFNCITGEMD